VRSRRRAFTIVELLVVICIILILVGLLLPAVTAAYRTAMEYECQNNLHQLAVVVATYCQDNDGYFPRATGATPSANDWLYVNDSPTNDNIYNGVLIRQKRVGTKMTLISGVYTKVGQTDLYYCPIDVDYGLTPKAGQIGSGLTMQPCETPRRLSSYVINGSITYGDTGNPRRVRRISDFDPNDFLFVEESEDSLFNGAFMTPVTSDYTLTKRHHGGGYIAYMDGSVQWWSQEDYAAEAARVIAAGGSTNWYKTATDPPNHWNPG